MSKLLESTYNDLRRIGGELSRLSFELLTVTGISDQDDDELKQQRLTEAMNHVEQAAHTLADLITDQPDDDPEEDENDDQEDEEDMEPYEEPLF